MKIAIVLSVVAAAVILLAGCASLNSIPKQLPETIRQGASAYEHIRPVVVDAREKAKSNWAAIPPDVQKVLLEIDAFLPQLDDAGQKLVLARDLLDAIDAGHGGSSVGSVLKNVNWDAVFSAVLKGAATVGQLKAQGVI